jgi:hypothetical protein
MKAAGMNEETEKIWEALAVDQRERKMAEPMAGLSQSLL